MSSTTPVSTERVSALLTDRQVEFGQQEDGKLVVLAPNAVFIWDTSNPQILQIRAHWRGIASTPEQFGTLMNEIATCNSTRIGPKAYFAPLEDGQRYGLIAECNIVTTHGLTRAQLDGFSETAMTMIMGFFADLEQALPEFVTWAHTLDTDPTREEMA